MIVYGCMYPWHFAWPHNSHSPFFLLMHNWDPRWNRFTFRDAAVNVVLYIPLGMAAHLIFRKWHVPGAGYWMPVLLGAALSASIEMTQVFVPTRNTSLNDLMNNVIGTVAGVVLGALFEKIAGPSFIEGIHFHPTDRGALVLVFIWLGYLSFPVFPITGLYRPARKLELFLSSPAFDPVLFISALATWYIAGKLFAAAGSHHPLRWLSCLLLIFPAQLFIVDRQPIRAGFLGAIAGILLYLLLDRFPTVSDPVSEIEAWAFLAVIVFRGLSPFHFTARQPFSWIPFTGLLATEWQSGVMILLEKAFYYGTAVWLLRSAGAGIASAAGLVAIVLAAIEGLQTHLIGRTAEITDPLIAIIMAFGFTMLYRERPFAAHVVHPGFRAARVNKR